MVKGMIGLEIHAYLTNNEKLFCACAASRERGLKPNVNVCPICTGQPGAKPYSPSASAVTKALQIGLILGCKINSEMKWMRKHYDWPDSPKGYQTTLSGAHAVPLGENGKFEGITIDSMHLEEDPASWDPKSGGVDYNRAGLPIVEIVTAPEFSFSEEVADWLRKLVHALSYLKIVDKDAGIKADVNVSILGKTERVEVKNINSIENVILAIEYELARQAKEGSVRETRRFDDSSGKTVTMRSKEKQEDYRFIVDPDLPVLKIASGTIESVRGELPELPSKKLERLIAKYKIDETNAEVLARHIDIVEFFEEILKKSRLDGKFVLPWVTVELLRVLNWNKTDLDNVDIKVEHFAKLLEMVKSGKITELQAKQVLNKFVPKSFDPSKVEGKIEDVSELKKIVLGVIKSNHTAAESYKRGDEKIVNFFMGEIMKVTQRRADYALARKILLEVLK